MFFRTMRLLALLLALVLVPAAHAQTPAATDAPRNVILFIADGTGPATFTLGRDYLRHTTGQDTLQIDGVLTGSVRTHASDSRVTDSAASATAYAAGVKTYNGAIAVDTLRQPVATIVEAAELQGRATGLVATSRITHATPAAFSAHVPTRSLENEIARQQLGQGIDVILGGGRAQFVPESEGGRRDDGRNLLAEAEAAGYTLVNDRTALLAAQAAPVLGLFTDSHMAYEVDRDPADEPSLAEMTMKAIELLDDDPDGFFLMVEGSRIDHAGHANDLAGHLHDLLAYDEAVAAALAYARADGNTLVVATSDHETGGLSLGREVDGRSLYTWRPAVVEKIKASHPVILGELQRRLREAPADRLSHAAVVREVLREWVGIDPTDDEVALLVAAGDDGRQANAALAEIVSRHAVVGWTTEGHTAVDVPLFAFGPGADHFIGHFDNTEIGQLLARLMDADLSGLTASMQEAGVLDPAGDSD